MMTEKQTIMKKLFLLLALIPVFVNAQKFELTINGFVDSENPEKDYIVIPFEGKSQKEIYDLALSAVGKSFISPKERVSNVEYSQININGIIPNVTYISRLGLKLYFDLYYNLIFEFKDGRMKINGLDINKIVRVDPVGAEQFICLSQNQIRNGLVYDDKFIFYKNGRLCSKKYKEHVETAVNELVFSFVNLMNKDNNSDW